MIHKETTATGETYVYMKWPNGSSILFEKYGIPTRNTDRDNGYDHSRRVSRNRHKSP